MGEYVRITDVSPRDGLQNEPLRDGGAPVPSADKLRLAELLAASGVDEVEATSFVSPKWVPQLADAEVVMGELTNWRQRQNESARRPVFSVLVPNVQGLERALAFHAPEHPVKVSLFTAASETFNQRNTNATIAESLERFRPVVEQARQHAMELRVYISCAVACPFEGVISPAQVRKVVDQIDALTLGACEIDLGDTIGVATPEQIAALLGVFSPAERGAFTLHLHDTFGRAAACVRTALQLGVRSFDGAAGGLGGCPYASTPGTRAPGNIATRTLVETVHGAGYTTGVNLAALDVASLYARQIVGRA